MECSQVSCNIALKGFMLKRKPAIFLLGLALLVMTVGCDASDVQRFFTSVHRAPTPEHLVLKVISKRPHDTTSYTEGLLLHDGILYESAGRYGQSSLRAEDPQTGKILRSIEVPQQYFGEGLALVGDRLIQLTWKEDTAFIYDVNTFARLGTFTYMDEGWGLCYDGAQLYMTDGSPAISARDPKTFGVVRQMQIMLDGQPVKNLNELECVGDTLYANVWMTNTILRIDKATGRVTGVIDATGLLTAEETAAAGSDGVLNGIAYDEQQGVFLITGKLWPWMFEVQFLPAQ